MTTDQSPQACSSQFPAVPLKVGGKLTDNAPTTRVALGFGANLGTPAETFLSAIRALEEAGFGDVFSSPLYQTAPIDCVPSTPQFINAAITGNWAGTAVELLMVCHAIECRLGRSPDHSSREARIVDIDILLFGNHIVQLPELIIPHPRLQERLFVLAPLADIAPTWPVPHTNATVEALRNDLSRKTGQADLVQKIGDNWLLPKPSVG